MPEEDPKPLQIHGQGSVVTIALNRPRQHNALNPALITSLSSAFQEISRRDDARVVILTGNGPSFCAGADLNHMRAAADYSFEENVADGHAIFDLMLSINQCSKPVVGRINGAAVGGGVGLVCCCDIAIAVEQASFAFSEVRLGLVPAVISPFVLAKIGASRCRELFLTGARFEALFAESIGLINDVVADEAALDDRIKTVTDLLLQSAPGAQAAAKRLISAVAFQPIESVRDYTARLIAERRDSNEGREGMSSFLAKRKPLWTNV